MLEQHWQQLSVISLNRLDESTFSLNVKIITRSKYNVGYKKDLTNNAILHDFKTVAYSFKKNLHLAKWKLAKYIQQRMYPFKFQNKTTHRIVIKLNKHTRNDVNFPIFTLLKIVARQLKNSQIIIYSIFLVIKGEI